MRRLVLHEREREERESVREREGADVYKSFMPQAIIKSKRL